MIFHNPELLFLLPSAYIALEFFSVEKFFKSEVSKYRNQNPFPLSIIKPVKGVDEHFREAIESFILQDYPVFEIIISVSASDKEAVTVVKEIINSFPDKDISMVASDEEHGSNGKVSRIINAFSSAKHDIIIISDSDVKIPEGYLASISLYFSDENIGMVTSLYTGAHSSSFAAKIESYGYLTDMIPKVLTARCIQGVKFGLGAFMALKRQAVIDIGGFTAISEHLADDYQLGNLISEKGWEIGIPAEPVTILPGKESFNNMMRRQLRWGRTIRVSRPLGFAGSVITIHFLWLLLLPLLAGFSTASLIAAFCYYLLRFGAAFFISKYHFKTYISPATLIIRDLISAVVWLSAWASNTVYWRGERYRVDRSGRMTKL